jgi:hypothetical protein
MHLGAIPPEWEGTLVVLMKINAGCVRAPDVRAEGARACRSREILLPLVGEPCAAAIAAIVGARVTAVAVEEEIVSGRR